MMRASAALAAFGAVLLLAIFAEEPAAKLSKKPATVGAKILVDLKKLDFPAALLKGQKVEFLSAFELSSSSDRFGGLSGILLDGQRLLAIGDRAAWLEAKVERDKTGALVRFASAWLGPLRGASGRTLRGTWVDAESLASDGRGGFWLGFERRHRFVRHRELHGKAVEIGGPLDKKALGSNSGLEGLARSSDGALWLFAEKRGAAGGQRGWRVHKGRSQAFTFDRFGSFDVTGADIGPDGALYVLERSFHWLFGVGMRVRRFTASQLADVAAGKSSDLGAGETLAQFDNSAPIDNMEGVSVERRKDGKMILTLISDDNFNAFQRTVLLQFLAEPAR